MKTWTQQAEKRLAEYLDERARREGFDGEEADELKSDLRRHIHEEAEKESGESIGSMQLEGILGRLDAGPRDAVVLGGLGGTASDIKIQAEQMLFIKKRMALLIAEHSGQSIEQIEKDSDRDRWFDAEEAKQYGLIDHVYSTSADAPSASARKGKGETK